MTRTPPTDLGILEERTAALADLAEQFDQAADNWRRSAAVARENGSLSSMCGEEGIPGHVLSTVRALCFEYAAKRVRSLIADEGWAP